MGLLNRLQAFLKGRPGNGDRGPLDTTTGILLENYQELLRLAEQISAHAERASYPPVGQRLRQIALEKETSAGVLRDKILSLGEKPSRSGLPIRSGKNHWARLVQDLQDQKELALRLRFDAARLALDAPEISDLLQRIREGELRHRDALQDFVVRADPQADLT